jgi:hypothetical protein
MRMEEVRAALGSNDIVSKANLPEALRRAPADTNRSTSPTPQTERNVTLG